MRIREFVWPKDRVDHIPQTDSIEELARFWDTQDLTDFEDELEEVTEPVFERESVVEVQLSPEEVEALNELARSKGIGSAELIREWVLEKIQPRIASRRCTPSEGRLL